MEVAAFVHGFILALGLIAALGPQNVFVFQQGANQPAFRNALPTIITAGVSDTLLILLAVLGVSVIVLQFAWLQTVLFGAGFLFLLYIGWALLTSPALNPEPDTSDHLGARKQIGFTLSVSLLNPHAILDTIGVIGTNALTYAGPDRWVFTASAALVSWGWFVGIAAAGWRIGESTNAGRWLQYFNYASAIIIWGVAVFMGWKLLEILAVL